MTRFPRSIVIAGGGTAGWLAALLLAGAARDRGAELDLTVIESSAIGSVGVGEGTTAVFRMMLKKLGLDEAEFLRETGATIKYGIRHRDWRRLGHHYDGPIDDPSQLGMAGLDLYAVSAGKPASDAHLFQHLMNRRKSPYALKGERHVPAGPFHHAFHFDQARAAVYLRSKADGVTVIDDRIVSVETAAEGDISALMLESGQRIEADFFVECTGFARALIGELGAKWVGYGDTLPVNRAMPFWIDLAEGEEIDPLTLAWAQKNGWMWKIPTQERYGCGYVYSDAHISPDEAKAEIEAALGHRIEPRNDIRINAGRLDKGWIGNCDTTALLPRRWMISATSSAPIISASGATVPSGATSPPPIRSRFWTASRPGGTGFRSAVISRPSPAICRMCSSSFIPRFSTGSACSTAHRPRPNSRPIPPAGRNCARPMTIFARSTGKRPCAACRTGASCNPSRKRK
ncbi:MAG: tryptophan 7-halogenase [Maritimibacter sp.]